MKIHIGSESGELVPSLDQSLEQIRASLAQQQAQWAELLAKDPAAFAQLEPAIHRVFQQFADHTVASLLAHAAAQPACAQAAQKK
jgi:hypothetical protein